MLDHSSKFDPSKGIVIKREINSREQHPVYDLRDHQFSSFNHSPKNPNLSIQTPNHSRRIMDLVSFVSERPIGVKTLSNDISESPTSRAMESTFSEENLEYKISSLGSIFSIFFQKFYPIFCQFKWLQNKGTKLESSLILAFYIHNPILAFGLLIYYINIDSSSSGGSAILVGFIFSALSYLGCWIIAFLFDILRKCFSYDIVNQKLIQECKDLLQNCHRIPCDKEISLSFKNYYLKVIDILASIIKFENENNIDSKINQDLSGVSKFVRIGIAILISGTQLSAILYILIWIAALYPNYKIWIFFYSTVFIYIFPLIVEPIINFWIFYLCILNRCLIAYLLQ